MTLSLRLSSTESRDRLSNGLYFGVSLLVQLAILSQFSTWPLPQVISLRTVWAFLQTRCPSWLPTASKLYCFYNHSQWPRNQLCNDKFDEHVVTAKQKKHLLVYNNMYILGGPDSESVRNLRLQLLQLFANWYRPVNSGRRQAMWIGAMSTDESWDVNRHTARCTSPVWWPYPRGLAV